MKCKLYLKIVVLDDFSNFSKSSFFLKKKRIIFIATHLHNIQIKIMVKYKEHM